MKQLFYTPVKDAMDGDGKYSRTIKVPQYIPSNKQPSIMELCDYSKYSKLMRSINESTVTDEEKEFLKFAASRHLAFNYAKIADYYAHASAEMQRLMEQSALVILDVDDAIANGYVQLSKKMELLAEEAKKNREQKT